MAGLWIALTLAVWSALCVAAGGLYVHRRYAVRLAPPAEHGCRREVEFRQAAPWWQEQIDRNRTHTLAVTR